MNWQAISTIAESVGAIAVVASLVFVGYQLIQNTEAVKTSNAQAHVETYFDIVSHLTGTRELGKLWTTGLFEPEELDEIDRARFIGILSGLFRYYETSYFQFRSGKLEKELWDTLELQMSSVASTPGFALWWSIREEWHSEEIKSFVNNMMEDDEYQLTYSVQMPSIPLNKPPDSDA